MSFHPMFHLICGLAALTVASIFYYYRAYLGSLQQRRRALRERVAYMLWVAADLAHD